MIALRSGVYRAHQWRGELTLLSAAPYDTTQFRFNDGKCDPAGNFWAGSMYEPRDQAAGRDRLDAAPPADEPARGHEHRTGVPPVAATYAGYDQGTVHALFAAASTPPARSVARVRPITSRRRLRAPREW